jgi:hypothetical protein
MTTQFGSADPADDAPNARRASGAACRPCPWCSVFEMPIMAEQARQTGVMPRDDENVPEWHILGCFRTRYPPQQFRFASPMQSVWRDTPPMLLLVGDADRTAHYLPIVRVAKRLREAIVSPSIDHGFLSSRPRRRARPACECWRRPFASSAGV